MMTKTSLILLSLLFCVNGAWAEGAWTVKGHAFTNVHAWQKGNEVKVSGRVSNGPVRSPLQATIYSTDDAGRTHSASFRIENYTGRGETFETQFTTTKRAKWWNITRIEVAGEAPREENRKQIVIQQKNIVNSPTLDVRGESTNQKCFPLKKTTSVQSSRVLFTSLSSVCVTIRDKRTNKMVLMKNISPHVLEEITMPYGTYSAKIIGDDFSSQKDFEIASENEVIEF